MSDASPHALDRIADLRRAFDQTFAVPPSQEVLEIERLLAIRVAGDPYSVRIREISGFAANRKIVALPSRIPELLGVAGIRGALVPVFSLAKFLGYGPSGEPSRWLALCGVEDPVGLTLGEFEGYLRVLRSEVYVPGPTAAAGKYVSQVARVGAIARPIINLALLVETIKRQPGRAGPVREE